MKKYPHFISSLSTLRRSLGHSLTVTTVLAIASDEPHLTTKTAVPMRNSEGILDEKEYQHIVKQHRFELVSMYMETLPTYVSAGHPSYAL